MSAMTDTSRSRKEMLQDRLTGTLIGLANAINGNEHLIDRDNSRLLLEALAATCPDADIDADGLVELIDRVQRGKYRVVPNCAECANRCGRTDDYDMNNLWNAPLESRTLRCRILEGVRAIAAEGGAADGEDREAVLFLLNALFAVGMDDWNAETLQAVLHTVEARRTDGEASR